MAPPTQPLGRGSPLTFCFLKTCNMLILRSNVQYYYPFQNSLIINMSLFSELYLTWRDKLMLRVSLLGQKDNLNFLSCIFREGSLEMCSQCMKFTGCRSVCYNMLVLPGFSNDWHWAKAVSVWLQAITGSPPTQTPTYLSSFMADAEAPKFPLGSLYWLSRIQ